MRVRIKPKKLCGEVRAIPSKSQAHRALFLAALSDAPTHLELTSFSEDTLATIRCLRSLGATVTEEEGGVCVEPIAVSDGVGEASVTTDSERTKERTEERAVVLRVGESGTTLRFLLPILGGLGRSAEIIMEGRLKDRPMEPLIAALSAHGMHITKSNDRLFTEGRLVPDTYVVPANISSQYISGLLLALPLLEEGSELSLIGEKVSWGYVDLTREEQERFGYQALEEEADGASRFVLSPLESGLPGRYHSPGTEVIEGDWSNAAFFLAAEQIQRNLRAGMTSEEILRAGMKIDGRDIGTADGHRDTAAMHEAGSEDDREDHVRVTGLIKDSFQRDRVAAGRMREIAHGDAVIDGKDIPDLIPILSVVAATSPGRTVFTGVERLRDKESDRLEAIIAMLRALGGEAEVVDDALVVTGVWRLRGGTVDGFGDHRIVMSAAVAAIACRNEVEITGAEAVAKSYPDFFDDYRALGGCVEVCEMS